MIVPAYGLTATERVLPRMALDFTTASLDSRVTITRALNTATRVNSSGLIETVNANLPRFDFSPTSVGTCRGLLIEESRANLALASGDLGNATYWIAQRATAVSASGTAPDGTNSATLATEDSTAGNDHLFARQNVTAAANATITKSVFLKNGATNGRRYAILSLLGATTPEWAVAVVDLVAGVVTTTNNGASGTYLSSSITPWYDGWWRCTLTGSVISANPQVRIQLSDTGTPASWGTYGRYLYNGNGVSNLYGWGMNVEAGAFATSYIPTTTTSLTRNADAVSMTGTNFSDWYNTSEGTLVFDYDIPTYLSFPVLGGIGQNTFNTTARFNVVNAIRANGSSFPATVVCGTAVKGAGKMALALKENDYAAYVNGSLNGADTSGTMIPAASNRFNIGWDETDDNTFLNAHIRKIQYYPLRLTNAQLAAISK